MGKELRQVRTCRTRDEVKTAFAAGATLAATCSRLRGPRNYSGDSSINLTKFTRNSFDRLQRAHYNNKNRLIGRYLS